VATGVGVVSPIGPNTQDFWSAALAGTVGTGEITLFDTSDYLTHRGGEVKDWRPTDIVTAANTGRNSGVISRSESFAVAAARMAFADAGLSQCGTAEDADRTGVCTGIVLGNRPFTEVAVKALRKRRPETALAAVHDLSVVSTLVAADLGLEGPNLVFPTACSAGSTAIGVAADLIAAGRADAMLAGGTDEMSETMFLMFNNLRALAPQRVQPFDLNRKGLMLSEGSAYLLLESEDHAAERGVLPYAVVAGYANTADAYHMTAPHPDGTGAVRAMRQALDMAKLTADDVDYVCAHATGTVSNDRSEAYAMHRVFGDDMASIPVSALKSLLGHPQGAASAIEAAACLLTIRDGIIPPTANLETLDPACPLDVVTGNPRKVQVNVAVNNAFGFGGNVCCTVFTAPAVG
jgi:3-oxoacyl-(acyl-carrier-protein) synthase